MNSTARETDLQIRGIERFHAADLLNVFTGFFIDHVDDVIGRHDAFHAAFTIDNRNCEQVLFGEQLRQVFLVQFLGRRDKLGSHDVADPLLSRGGHQPAQGNDAQQALIGIEHVGIVNRLYLLRLTAQIRDCLIHGHIRPQPRETRAHQAAGIVFGVSQQGYDFTAVVIVEEGEEIGSLLLGSLLDDVRGIIGRKQAHPDAALVRRER
jgi:hypothetical protein